MAHEVTLITGDGTGPELAEAARKCVDATGVTTIQLTHLSIVLSAAGGSFSTIFAQGQGTLDFSVAAVPQDPVPEPETWALMLAGLGGLALLAKKRSRAV